MCILIVLNMQYPKVFRTTSNAAPPTMWKSSPPTQYLLTRLSRLQKILMLNFIAPPRSTVLVNIVILHFLQVTLLLMFQLVSFIILLNEIFLYSSAPLTSMAAPQPLAGGRDEMNSSLIRNNNNKNTHKDLCAFYFILFYLYRLLGNLIYSKL